MFSVFVCFCEHLQNSKKNLHNWFLINSSRLVNLEGPGFTAQSSKSCKPFLKNIAHDYICWLANIHDQMTCDSKDTLKKNTLPYTTKCNFIVLLQVNKIPLMVNKFY